MFTGIVEETGVVLKIRKGKGSVIFTLGGKIVMPSLRIGSSIALDGTCLTIIKKTSKSFDVQAVEETLQKTSLGTKKVGDRINLERPLRAGAELGGHFVLGHVDTTARVVRIDEREESWMVWFTIPKGMEHMLIPVGSVAIDGVSLTVAQLRKDRFGISIIPHTWKVTTFGNYKPGNKVNVEFDVLGKYVQRILATGSLPSRGKH